jgi:SH3-like domain-containing protein
MPLIWTLRDTFTDGTVDPVKWSDSYGVISETGGRARVTCDTNYAAFSSAQAYTLEESAAWVQIFPPADGGAAAEAYAQLLVTSSTAGTDAVVEVNAAGGVAGVLGMGVRVGYFDPDFLSIPYDPDAHAWVRIRETAGALLWETSYDGRIWVVQRTVASPPWVGDADIQVQLLAHRDGGVNDFAEFDSFNVDHLTILTDNFNDGVVDSAKWPASFGGYSETGGRARVSCDTGFSAYASAALYTLQESVARCQLFPPAAGGAATEAWAQLLVTSSTPGTDAVAEVNAATGQLAMRLRAGFIDTGPVLLPYDPVAHAWVRIREASGSLLWETSPDGITWATRRTAASPAWVSATDLQVQLLAHRDSGTVNFAEFDNFNVAPFAQLTDDFNSLAVDTVKWPDNYNEAGPLPSQPDGRARVPCNNGFAAYASAATYTLSESHAGVQVFPPAVGGATGSVFCQLLILSDVAGTQIVFELDVSINLLRMTLHVDYTDEGGASLPYDPAEHAWLRVRETGGTLFWDTSADGRAWTVRHSDTAPAWVLANNHQVQLLAFRDNGVDDYAEFDNFNITPVLPNGYAVAIDWNSDGSFDGPYDDVTDSVLQRGPVVFQYGRDQDRQLAPPSVGSMTMTLCNADRIYSPENPDSPIADELSPAAPVKVETVYEDVVYPLFSGRIEDFEVHPDRGDRSADISAVSLLSLLQGTKVSTGLFEANRTGALIAVILDEIGWTGPRDIDLGATHVPYWWLEEADAFTAMTDLLDSEGPPSIAYVGPDGTFIFRDRHHRLLRQASITPQASFASRRIGPCDPCTDGVELYGSGCYGDGDYGG